MKILYVVLLLVLLGTYGFVLNRVRLAFNALTPILGWMVGLGYFVLASLTILTLNGGYKFPSVYGLSGTWGEVDLSKPEFLRPYLLIWLSLMLTCAVAFFSIRPPAQELKREYVISDRKLERIILITMGLLLLDWIATVWMTGGIAEFLISHWYRRLEPMAEQFGSAFSLYLRLSLANRILFTAAAALYASEGLKRRNVPWGFTSLIFLFLLLDIVMIGNRMFFAFYLLAFLTSCWLYRRKKILATVLATSPLIVLVFSVWGWVRQDVSKIPDSVDTYVIDADMGNRALTSLMDVTEGSAVMLMMHVVNDFGNKYPYLYGSTYSRLFTSFEPRTLYPERTPDFQEITANLYEPGSDTSLGSTSLGEGFANFGFFGVLVPPLFTWLILRYSEWLARAAERHSLLSAVSFITFISFARSTFAMNAMTLICAAVLIWLLKMERGLCTRTAAGKTQNLVGIGSTGPPPAFPLGGEASP